MPIPNALRLLAVEKIASIDAAIEALRIERAEYEPYTRDDTAPPPLVLSSHVDLPHRANLHTIPKSGGEPRPHRPRNGVGESEYRYAPSGYRRVAKDLGIGSHDIYAVWLTISELAQVQNHRRTKATP